MTLSKHEMQELARYICRLPRTSGSSVSHVAQESQRHLHSDSKSEQPLTNPRMASGATKAVDRLWQCRPYDRVLRLSDRQMPPTYRCQPPVILHSEGDTIQQGAAHLVASDRLSLKQTANLTRTQSADHMRYAVRLPSDSSARRARSASSRDERTCQNTSGVQVASDAVYRAASTQSSDSDMTDDTFSSSYETCSSYGTSFSSSYGSYTSSYGSDYDTLTDYDMSSEESDASSEEYSGKYEMARPATGDLYEAALSCPFEACITSCQSSSSEFSHKLQARGTKIRQKYTLSVSSEHWEDEHIRRVPPLQSSSPPDRRKLDCSARSRRKKSVNECSFKPSLSLTKQKNEELLSGERSFHTVEDRLAHMGQSYAKRREKIQRERENEEQQKADRDRFRVARKSEWYCRATQRPPLALRSHDDSEKKRACIQEAQKNKAEAEMGKCLFRPDLCKKSRKIMRALPATAGFQQRQSEWQQRKTEKLRSSIDANLRKETFSFQPVISKKSRYISSKLTRLPIDTKRSLRTSSNQDSALPQHTDRAVERLRKPTRKVPRRKPRDNAADWEPRPCSPTNRIPCDQEEPQPCPPINRIQYDRGLADILNVVENAGRGSF